MLDIVSLSRVTRNSVFGFPARLDTNWAVLPEKMARGLKFQICEVEGLYYLCSEINAQLICAFVFTYAKSRFFHDTAV